MPPISERSVESDSELVARELGLPVSEVENALAFRAKAEEQISGLPGLVRYGWDELPSRSGFVELVGSADRSTVDSLDALGIRVIDGFAYTPDERRARVRAVTNYLAEHEFKGAIVRHTGDQVVLELAESQHRTIETADLADALVNVISAASEDKATPSSDDQIIIRSVPDTRIPTRRARKKPPNEQPS